MRSVSLIDYYRASPFPLDIPGPDLNYVDRPALPE
jgi:hypothetical protein